MSQEKRFSNKITRVSFWLAICVVYIHANNTTTYQFDFNNSFQKLVFIIENWFQGSQQCVVPVFMMISGFLFFRNYNSEKYLIKLKTRTKSLLVPYLIWTNVPWICLVIVKQFPLASTISTDASFTIQSWIDFTIFTHGTVLWYVRVLIVYALLTPIIYVFLKRKKTSICIIGLLFLQNIVLLTLHINIVESIYNCVPYLIGAWLSIWKPGLIINRANKKLKLTGVIVFVILFCLAIDYKHVLYYPTTQYIYKTLLPLPLWFALDFFPFEKSVCKVERLSFPIYCTHAIILETFEKLLYVLGGNNIYIASFSYLFMPICVVTVLICMFFLFEKYFPCTYKFVFGNRG